MLLADKERFLKLIEDFLAQDSLIGSTISTRSKTNASSATKVSLPSVLSEDTEISKTLVKSNTYDFYPKHLNHAFMPRQVFEAYRNDVIKTYEDEQYSLGVDEHQMPDHTSTFMKMVKGRSQAISAANDERRQVLPSRAFKMEV
jgi:hypothetical protein